MKHLWLTVMVVLLLLTSVALAAATTTPAPVVQVSASTATSNMVAGAAVEYAAVPAAQDIGTFVAQDIGIVATPDAAPDVGAVSASQEIESARHGGALVASTVADVVFTPAAKSA